MTNVTSRVLRFAGPLLAIASLAWCLFIGRHLWITPLHVHVTQFAGSVDGKFVERGYDTTKRFSDTSMNGPLPLIIPVLLAAMACTGSLLRLIGLAGGGTLLLFGFSIISGFSIGGYYLPPVVGFALAIACELRLQRKSGAAMAGA